jgi:hypothetical protein
MIVLCANCHRKADLREITEDELFGIKRTIAKGPSQPPVAAQSSSIRVEQQVADQIINVAGSPTIKLPNRGQRKVVVPAPPGAISEAQLREIDDQAARLAKEIGGKVTVGFLKKRIMQDWSLTTVRHLPQSEYASVINFLRRFRLGQRANEPGSVERQRLNREAHAKARNIGWTHDRLSEHCRESYGQSLSNLSINLLRDLCAKLSGLEDQASHMG